MRFVPLVAGGVDACGVVGAGVEEDDAAFGGLVDGERMPSKSRPLVLAGEVGVVFDGEVDVAEDLVVVGPCWGGEVDVLGVGRGWNLRGRGRPGGRRRCRRWFGWIQPVKGGCQRMFLRVGL